jgi:hypothetical protein
MIKLLAPFGITHFYTDGWGAYRRHLDPQHAYRGETADAKDRTQTPHVPDAYQTLDKENHLFFTLYSYA